MNEQKGDTVADAIADAVTQTDAVVASAVDFSGAATYQSFAHSTALMFENAVAEQQRGTMTANATADLNVRELLSVGVGARAGVEADVVAGVSAVEQLNVFVDLLQQLQS